MEEGVEWSQKSWRRPFVLANWIAQSGSSWMYEIIELTGIIFNFMFAERERIPTNNQMRTGRRWKSYETTMAYLRAILLLCLNFQCIRIVSNQSGSLGTDEIYSRKSDFNWSESESVWLVSVAPSSFRLLSHSAYRSPSQPPSAAPKLFTFIF